MWETGDRQHPGLFFMSPNQLINHHLSTAWMTYHALLTPLEPPCPLQNLSVTLANWGMNRPTPFLMGAFAVIQPCFNQRALAVILLFLSDQSRLSETKKVDVLDSRQGRHIETGERMPHMGFYDQAWMSFHPKDDIWQKQCKTLFVFTVHTLSTLSPTEGPWPNLVVAFIPVRIV